MSQGTRKRYGNLGITEFSGKLKTSFCEHRKPEDNLFNENGLHKFAICHCVKAQPLIKVWAITVSAMTPIFGADWWI